MALPERGGNSGGTTADVGGENIPPVSTSTVGVNLSVTTRGLGARVRERSGLVAAQAFALTGMELHMMRMKYAATALLLTLLPAFAAVSASPPEFGAGARQHGPRPA